jgi:hypothetical protein
MLKTNGSAGKVPKHFETVPLEVVKEIAVADVPTNETPVVADEIVEPAKKRLLMPVPTRAPAGEKR